MRFGLAIAALAGGLLVACGPNTPASLDYVQHTPAQPRLGESTAVEFMATDNRGLPQPGVTVHFRLQNSDQNQGVTLVPDTGTTEKETGAVTTTVHASGQVASVVVVAYTDGPNGRTASSPPITFAGTAASGRQFTFQCGHLAGDASGGIHAIGAFDQTRSLVAGVKVECTAHVGDRNGDGVPNAIVSFLTEAGTIGPSETSQSDVIGNATVLYKTTYPLPKDVVPSDVPFSFSPPNDDTHTGQYLVPLWMHPFDWKKNPVVDYNNPNAVSAEPRRVDPIRPGIINNPRDNLVTLIAVTAGEEGFTDVNGNGVYDDGEPFDDLTEPFVDSNDNGTWDPDERFIDTNNDGKWNGKNGKWDGSTLIWTQERILWTGVPHTRDFNDTVSPVFKQVSGPPVVQHFQTAYVTVLISDPWFNTPAQNSPSDGCSLVYNATHPVIVPDREKFGDVGLRYTYPSVMLATVGLTDAHDPQANPPDLPWSDPSRVPTYPSGLPFTVGISCDFTTSPLQGYTVAVAAPGINGVVF